MADWWKRFKAMNALQGGDPGTPILVDYRQFQKAGNKEGVEILKKQNEAAAELAKKKGKATVNALTFIGGLKNPFGLLGDLGITTISTLANTALDGNTDNLTKNLATNAMFDVAGKGAGDAISYVGKKIRPVLQKIIKRTPKTSYAPVLSIDTNDKFVQNNYYVDFLNEYSQVDPKGAEQLKYYLTLPEIPAPEVGSYEDVLGNVYSTD